MRVQVWNDNPHTNWVETFKGEEVRIKSGGFIEMEFYDGHEFKGQFSPIRILADETQDPKSFKMIRVVKIEDNAADEDDEIEFHQCNLCKKAYATNEALLKHSKEHADRVVVDTLAEEMIPKRKPGRPAKLKEATA